MSDRPSKSKSGNWWPCDYRLINAMAVGIDRAINPGQPDEIAAGTPIEDFRTAALAIGCLVRRARKLMKDAEFLNDLATARSIAKEQRGEAEKYIASLGREPDDLDEPLLEALNPLVAHAVTKREFRRLNPRPSSNPGYIVGAPPPIPPAYGSIAEQETAMARAKEGLIAEPMDAPVPAPRRTLGVLHLTVNTDDGVENRIIETMGKTVGNEFLVAGGGTSRKPRPPRWSLTDRRL